MRKQLEERISTLNAHNHDLQLNFIEMQKDKNIFRDQNEALEQKVTDLGLKIVTLENKLQYS